MITINDYTVQHLTGCHDCMIEATDGFQVTYNIDPETGETTDLLDPVVGDALCEICGAEDSVFWHGVILKKQTTIR